MEEGNSLRDEMKDKIRGLLTKELLSPYFGEDMLLDLTADLADAVFEVMCIPEGVQDLPHEVTKLAAARASQKVPRIAFG